MWAGQGCGAVDGVADGRRQGRQGECPERLVTGYRLLEGGRAHQQRVVAKARLGNEGVAGLSHPDRSRAACRLKAPGIDERKRERCEAAPGRIAGRGGNGVPRHRWSAVVQVRGIYHA